MEEDSKKYLTINTHMGSVLAQQTWCSASHQHLLSGSAPLVKCWKEHLAQAGKDNEQHMANLEKSCDGFSFMG